MNGENVMSIGDRLRYARGDRSQAEVAEAVGFTTMAISKLETDQMKPSYETMQKLARYFGLSVDRLFF